MSRLDLVESDEAALLKQGRATSKVLYPGPDGSSALSCGQRKEAVVQVTLTLEGKALQVLMVL